MKTFFTSDWHLGHNGVISYCNRPFKSVDDMDDTLVRNFNQDVGHGDETYFLGDMSFHKPRIGVPLLRRLHGQKFLVLGNHDSYSVSQYHDAGFGVVCNSIGLTYRGHNLTLSHYPFWPKQPLWFPDKELRYQDRRPVDTGQWLLHGHVHCLWKQRIREINVGVDVWDFRPVPGDALNSIFSKGKPPEGLP